MRVENAVRNGLLVGLTALSLSFSPSWVGAADEPVAADSKAPTAEVQKDGKDAKKGARREGKAGRNRPAHPDTSQWQSLFKADLSDAVTKAGVWTVDKDGVMTASQDEAIWTPKDYEDFVLDLEFKTENGTNSGVVVHCSDTQMWIPNSIEIQIADDFSEKWSKEPPTWHCAAIFGRLAPTKSLVKKPGEWNRMTVTCRGKMITVALNGERVTRMDMSKWTDPKKNPDGSDIPEWLSKPAATLPLKGKIGLQGKHADASIFFRNVKIRELQPRDAAPDKAEAAQPETK